MRPYPFSAHGRAILWSNVFASIGESSGAHERSRASIPATRAVAKLLPVISFVAPSRHGTRTFIVNFDVVSGRVIAPSCGPTRTEADFQAHVQRTVESEPAAGRWHFVTDNLDTHCSESLVRYVAEVSGITEDLGKKQHHGILQSRASRATFLREPSHKVVLHYTPKHASWMNQVEIWFSILMRKLLRRGSFTSVADLETKVLAFIDYFNRTMAKPFKWTYQGKPLRV